MNENIAGINYYLKITLSQINTVSINYVFVRIWSCWLMKYSSSVNKKNYKELNSMKNCLLIDDASIQNHRASRGARGANSHKDPTWRSQHTHELCANTFNLTLCGCSVHRK